MAREPQVQEVEAVSKEVLVVIHPSHVLSPSDPSREQCCRALEKESRTLAGSSDSLEHSWPKLGRAPRAPAWSVCLGWPLRADPSHSLAYTCPPGRVQPSLLQHLLSTWCMPGMVPGTGARDRKQTQAALRRLVWAGGRARSVQRLHICTDPLGDDGLAGQVLREAAPGPALPRNGGAGGVLPEPSQRSPETDRASPGHPRTGARFPRAPRRCPMIGG